ncbi:MAG: type II toxin-antitoxin system VapC family toxin [Elainellaceae cyanobacterium]
MLLDSNLIIYAAQPQNEVLRDFIAEHAPSVSLVSYVEVFGYHKLSDCDRQFFEEFFDVTDILPVTHDVATQAIELRQQRKLSLGDSLVAGTALRYDLTLLTHNTDDFRWIPDLKLFDPLLERL